MYTYQEISYYIGNIVSWKYLADMPAHAKSVDHWKICRAIKACCKPVRPSNYILYYISQLIPTLVVDSYIMSTYINIVRHVTILK